MSRRQIGSSITRVETSRGPRWRFRVDAPPAPDGRRRQRTLTYSSEREAIEAQARARVAIAGRAFVDPSRLTLSSYLDDWLAAGARQWRPSTHYSYASALQPARETLGHKRIQQLTRADLERLVSLMLASGGRDGAGRSPRTVGLLLTVLHKALDDAIHDDLLVRNVVANVRRPSRAEREMKVWTPAQVRRFLAQVADDPLVGCWHSSMRGLRRGEVLGLRWPDIDFAKHSLTVRTTRVQVGGRVVVGGPKTERGRRTLPVDPQWAAALSATKERTMASIAGWVAVDPFGEPVNTWSLRQRLPYPRRGSGLPYLRVHDLRHTAATTMLEAGVPVTVVAAFLGHDPSVTLRTYGHANPHALREAGQALSALYGTG